MIRKILNSGSFYLPELQQHLVVVLHSFFQDPTFIHIYSYSLFCMLVVTTPLTFRSCRLINWLWLILALLNPPALHVLMLFVSPWYPVQKQWLSCLTADGSDGHTCVCVCYIHREYCMGSSWQRLAAHLSEAEQGPHLKNGSDRELLLMHEVRD